METESAPLPCPPRRLSVKGFFLAIGIGCLLAVVCLGAIELIEQGARQQESGVAEDTDGPSWTFQNPKESSRPSRASRSVAALREKQDGEMEESAAPPAEKAVEPPAQVVDAPAFLPAPRVIRPNLNTAAIRALPPEELVWYVASHYPPVPGCLLWAVWKMESSLLKDSWSANWTLGIDTIAKGGRCVARYKVKKCTRHWLALVSICKQVQTFGPDAGKPVCDPEMVRTSEALAVGPLQLMPGEMIRDPFIGTPNPERAIDFDGDGVTNPFELPDALAMAAKKLRDAYFQYKDSHLKYQPWQKAAIRYYGLGKGSDQFADYSHYYFGTGRGVKKFWGECCCKFGRCPCEKK